MGKMRKIFSHLCCKWGEIGRFFLANFTVKKKRIEPQGTQGAICMPFTVQANTLLNGHIPPRPRCLLAM